MLHINIRRKKNTDFQSNDVTYEVTPLGQGVKKRRPYGAGAVTQ